VAPGRWIPVRLAVRRCWCTSLLWSLATGRVCRRRPLPTLLTGMLLLEFTLLTLDALLLLNFLFLSPLLLLFLSPPLLVNLLGEQLPL